MADRIAVMEAGRIRQLGTPSEVFRRPANTFVAELHRLDADEPARAGSAATTLAVAGVRLPVPERSAGRLTDGEQDRVRRPARIPATTPTSPRPAR